MFPTGENIEEVITKDRITAKVKNIRTDFKKVCDSGKKVEEGMLYLHFTIYVKVYGEAIRLSIQYLMALIHKIPLSKNRNQWLDFPSQP